MGKGSVLVSVNVPFETPKEVLDARQKIFDKEVGEICERYLANGATFKRGFNFEESGEMNGRIRNLHEFPKHLGIPNEAQGELARAWAKLFA
jgi:hypothetical protein